MSNGFHHLRARHRRGRSPSQVLRSLDYVMYVAAFVAPLALLPQVYQLFVYQNAAGLSLVTWLILGCINLLWSFYGFVHKDTPIILANLLVGILDFVVVYGIFLFRP